MSILNRLANKKFESATGAKQKESKTQQKSKGRQELNLEPKKVSKQEPTKKEEKDEYQDKVTKALELMKKNTPENYNALLGALGKDGLREYMTGLVKEAQAAAQTTQNKKSDSLNK